MAEIIGIVSGLVSLSEAGYRISKVLYSFGKSVFKAREQINELARELDSISSAFECLADVLKTSEGLLKPTLLDTTQAILDDCERTYTEIEENVHTVERQSLKAKERAQWPFRKAKVKQLRTRLESAKATLSLMVNILNLSAGIKFLRQQAQPPEDRVEDTRQLFETSTKSVIDTQLAFDKAEKYEKRLAEQDGSRTGRRLKSSSQPKSQSHALVKARPMSDIAAEIPGFELLSLVRWNETRRDGYDSEDSQDGEDEALARYDDLKCQAPAIVRQLCDGWTGLDQDNLQGHARISAHPLAGDMPGDVNLESSLGNANEAEPSRPPKLRGLSLYDANQDEPPARFSSYSNGASRRDYGGLDPVCKSAQKSPLLRKEGNGSRSDPFSSVLPERSGYTYSGKTPRPAISSGPRSDKAKGRAFGSSIAADQKQDFSPRSKENTSNKLEDDFNLQAQPDTVDPLEENDFSDHGTSGPAPGHPLRRRSAQQPSLSSRSQQDWGLSNDQVKPENHPLRPVSHGVVPDLSFLSIHFSHCKGSGFDVINLYPLEYTPTSGHVVLKFKLNSIRDGLLKVAHVHDAAKMVVQIKQYPINLHLLDNGSVFNGREQRDTPLINLRHLSSAVGWRSGLAIGCQAIIRSRLWPSTGKTLGAGLLWFRMKSVGIWTYGELPCRQELGPTGGSHATRGCSLLVAARSS